MNKAKAAVARKGTAAKPVNSGVRNGLPQAGEMVQWTISSDERAEHKRGAGRS